MGERLIQWFERKEYDFFDEVKFDEDKAIFEGDIERLMQEALKFKDRQTEFKTKERDNTEDIINRHIVPDWEDIIEKNKTRLQEEIGKFKESTKKQFKEAKTTEERKEAEIVLRKIDTRARILGGLRSGEVRRAKAQFRKMFTL